MAKKSRPADEACFLGIEGGGTRTVALLTDARGQLMHRAEAGPGNLKLLTDAQLLRHFRLLAAEFPKPSALGIGMAGARTGFDLARVRRAAARIWPRTPCYATDDLETALAAAEAGNKEGRRQKTKPLPHRRSSFSTDYPMAASVLVLSGTGSCCYGRNNRGRTAKIGGWGHVLGDVGSAYAIGLRGLRAVLHAYDQNGEWPHLGNFILRSLSLNEPEALVEWVHRAGKVEIAALAVEVFAAWRARDRLATKIVHATAEELASEAAVCARRLTKPGQPVKFVLAGGTLLKQTRFARLVSERLKTLCPGASVVRLRRESVWGAVELARRQFKRPLPPARVEMTSETRRAPSYRSKVESPTEQRNPRSMNLDRLPISQAVTLMLAEDAEVLRALRAESGRITRAVELISSSLRRGGRLFYVGAGTSGRLGVLDASECPPTFRTSPEQVQGIIAGGAPALWRAVEGAEDDPTAGTRAIQFRRVNSHDVVVGIAASGRTPFVWGALVEAKRRRARTILLTFNPHLKFPVRTRPTLVIAPNVGPEILTGSTRLKASSATKLVLNVFTTLAMVQLGKVTENLMVDLHPSNAKLRERAMRIVQTLTGADPPATRAALEKSRWVVKNAVARLRRARGHLSA